jgi:hypothetical protein
MSALHDKAIETSAFASASGAGDAARRRSTSDIAAHPLQRSRRAPPDAPSNPSDVGVRSFALAFFGLLCATVVGFMSEIRPLKPDSPDYDYDEALGIGTSSLYSAKYESNCSDDSPATAGASKGGLDRLGVSAIATHGSASPTTKPLTPRQ